MTHSAVPLPLPAIILLLSAALSCSTACITSAVVDEAAAQSRQRAINEATILLAQNRHTQAGQTATPTVTSDPLSIEQALRPALPARRTGGSEPYYKNVEVRLQPPKTPSVYQTYRIIAYGDFTTEYVQAFVDFSRTLLDQLPDKTLFIIEACTGTPAAPVKITQRYVYRSRQ